MTVLTLGYIVAMYKIPGKVAVDTWSEYQNRLYNEAFYKNDIDRFLDDEKICLEALKLTERYARRYYGEKYENYESN